MLEVSIIGLILIALIVFFIKCTSKHEDIPKKYTKTWDKSITFDINSEDISDIHISENSSLKILQLTDIHYDHSNGKKEKTLELLSSVIEKNSPNLIVITGDWSAEKKRTSENSKIIFDIVDRYDIPWAPVFGNHDDENDMSKADYIELFSKYENCLFKVGYTNLGGVGNYIVNVRTTENEKLIASLFMIDSNSHTAFNIYKYQPIYKKQVEWYAWAVDGLKNVYKEQGNTEQILPSLAFFHIPLTEFRDIYNDPTAILSGENKEKASIPIKNTGLTAVLAEKQSTKGVFVGHDHDNNAVMDYKGIKFVYGVQSGWCDDYATTSPKGATVIEMNISGDILVDRSLFDI